MRGRNLFIFLFIIIIIINRSKHTVIISSILLIGSISGYTVRKEREKVVIQVVICPSPREEREHLSICFILITFNWDLVM